MRKGLKLALSGALCSATLATAVPEEAIAGPMSAPDRSIVAPSSPVENVWYRRGWGYRGGWGRRYGYRRGYYNPGGAIAAGVGLGLLGAGLAAASSGYGGYWLPLWLWLLPGRLQRMGRSLGRLGRRAVAGAAAAGAAVGVVAGAAAAGAAAGAGKLNISPGSLNGGA